MNNSSLRSAIEDYIDDIKTKGVSFCLDVKMEIIRGHIDNQYNDWLDWDLGIFVEDNKNNVIYYDTQFTVDTRKRALDVVRSEVFELILPELRRFGHEASFYHDGELRVKLTTEHALSITKDVPLSCFLMDTAHFRSAMNDKQLVCSVISQSGCLLEYSSEAFRNNKEVVTTAFKNDSRSFLYASEDLKADKTFVLALVNNPDVEKSGHAIGHSSIECRSDREIVYSAVSKNAFALQYVSDELKADKEIVLAAFHQSRADPISEKEWQHKSEMSLLRHASEDIQLLCKDKDPVEALTKAINYDILTKRLSSSVEPDQPKRKLKI